VRLHVADCGWSYWAKGLRWIACAGLVGVRPDRLYIQDAERVEHRMLAVEITTWRNVAPVVEISECSIVAMGLSRSVG
jgi:hypothetical protein